MRKLFLLLFCFIVSPVFGENATSFCSSMNTRVHIRTNIGNPQYVSQYSREDFLKKAGGKQSANTLGLTVAKPDIKVQADPNLQEFMGQICVGLSDIDIEIGYSSLIVYIDKKYAPSSCEYQTIKEHENYHVQVAQQAISFFKPDIEKVVHQAVSKLSPRVVYSRNEVQPHLNKMVASVVSALQPVVQHMADKLAEKNAAIDTLEMYQKTTAVCDNW